MISRTQTTTLSATAVTHGQLGRLVVACIELTLKRTVELLHARMRTRVQPPAKAQSSVSQDCTKCSCKAQPKEASRQGGLAHTDVGAELTAWVWVWVKTTSALSSTWGEGNAPRNRVPEHQR